jgi:hypothetical protein
VSAAAFLADGKADSDRYEPLRVLRELLLKGHARDLKQRYGKMEYALKLFIEHATSVGVKRLREVRVEFFRLPEETADDDDGE